MDIKTNDSNTKYLLQSVTNALKIIELLGEFNFLTLTEISQKLKLGKSTVFRLVATLEAQGFVKKDKYGRCRLGMKLSYFGSVVLARMEVLQTARPYLEDLQREIKETVHLAVWDDNWDIRFVDKINGAIPFHMQSFVGLPKTCYSTATGKAMLANMGKDFIQQFLQEVSLKKITPHTITESEKLLEALEKIRNIGYCLSIEEDEIGLTCIGAPIIDISQKPIAAISISGPTTRILDHTEEYAKKIISVAREISKNLT